MSITKIIIKKKLVNLVDKELPLLSSLFPNFDLTKISKIALISHYDPLLTEPGKVDHYQYISPNNSSAYDNYKKINDNLKNSKLSQVARPRFELGSKAPKASMLGHYTRHSNTTGLPGIFIL